MSNKIAVPNILNEEILHTELNEVLNRICGKYHPQVEQSILYVQKQLHYNMQQHSHGHSATSKIFLGFQKLSRILLAYINIEKNEFFQELIQMDLEDEMSLLTFDLNWIKTMQFSQERRLYEIMTLLDGLHEITNQSRMGLDSPEGFKELVFRLQDFDLVVRKYAHFEQSVLNTMIHEALSIS